MRVNEKAPAKLNLSLDTPSGTSMVHPGGTW